MRRNNFQVNKALVFAAGVVLTCILIGWAAYGQNKGKSTFNNGTNQYAMQMSEYQELDKSIYDNLVVDGSEVIRVIKKMASDDAVSVKVTTSSNQSYEKANGTESAYRSQVYVNSTYNLTDKSNSNYINENASFTGTITKNENGLVSLITFTQLDS